MLLKELFAKYNMKHKEPRNREETLCWEWQVQGLLVYTNNFNYKTYRYLPREISIIESKMGAASVNIRLTVRKIPPLRANDIEYERLRSSKIPFEWEHLLFSYAKNKFVYTNKGTDFNFNGKLTF